MHGDAPHSAERLEDPPTPTFFEPLFQKQRHCFGDDRVQTLFVVLDALVELGEQEVAALEVGSQVGAAGHFLVEPAGKWVGLVADEVMGTHFEVD